MSASTWLKRKLSSSTVETLRSVRHTSAQMLAGANLWELRLELERRIEERLSETEAAQDARLLVVIREQIAIELDRWSQDMLDRMDILLGASNRLVALLEERVAELERRLAATSEDAPEGHPGAPEVAAPKASVGS